MMKALVIGGMNIDILGAPAGAFHPGDSLPGHIHLSVGGVGFNIASRLSKMGVKVSFITAFGNDMFASMAQNACDALNIDTALSILAPSPSPTYMAIHVRDGSMTAAINDMSALAFLTPDYLKSHKAALSAAFDLCVIDANLPEDTLLAIPHLVPAPLLADPVSCEKGRRLLPILSRLKAIKPNAMEALALSGRQDIPDAAKWFLGQGAQQVYISLGRDGLYYADGYGAGCLSVDGPVNVPSTGAGDAMAAGLAFAIMGKANTPETARAGLLAASQFLKNKQEEQSQ